jgi:hypothetical protein
MIQERVNLSNADCVYKLARQLHAMPVKQNAILHPFLLRE